MSEEPAEAARRENVSRSARKPATGTDLASARRAARERLTTLCAGLDGEPWQQALRLLRDVPTRLPGPELDAFVGAASDAVDAGGSGDPDVDAPAAGLDHLLLATGLRLRDRLDAGGRGPQAATEARGSLLASARCLRAAAERIPPTHPAAGAVVEVLGSLLDAARPLSGPVAEVAAPLGTYAGAIVSPGTAVAALGGLCRAIAAVRSGNAVESAALEVATLPAGHRLRTVLDHAARHLRLVVAVRSRDRAAIRANAAAKPSTLAAVLVALTDDDPDALRSAVDRVAAAAGSDEPAVAAVVGAVRLHHGDEADLDAAIAMLRRAGPVLGDSAGAGLRTRTLWRLAAAYRKRGAPGDAERSRTAGLLALRGADQDAASPARFAGWMLADGRAEEAFAALETAATLETAARNAPAPANPRTTGESLVDDVAAVLTGLAPPGTPPPNPPGQAEVAAALRGIGAVALIYLHPTDEPGRTVGILCLDAATDRLDVVANVPVTDPTVSDDPTWSAIAERWLDRRHGAPLPRVLLAATGDLARIAFPAACTGAGRRLAEELDVSRVGSGGEVIRLAGREPRPLQADPVYATGLDAATIRAVAGAGRLVVLPPSEPDTFDPIATALLDAGCTGVIGWLRPVDPPVAALARFMLHLGLVDEGLTPSAAVGSVQRWMIDPGRTVPPALPATHAETARTVDLTRPPLWASLTYRGC